MTADPPKRRRRKEARPAEILDAGMAAFAENGFAGTRLEDVAARAGIAKATIYLYYPSKEALFEAAMQDRMVGAIEGFSQMPLAFDGPTDAVLRRFLGTLIDLILDTDATVLLKVLIGEGHRFPRLAATYREAVVARGLTMLESILARGAARGDLRLAPGATDPRSLLAPAIMTALWTILFADEAITDRAAYLDRQLEILLHGLLARPEPTR